MEECGHGAIQCHIRGGACTPQPGRQIRTGLGRTIRRWSGAAQRCPASILVRYDQLPLAEAITCGCLKPRSDPYRNNLPLAISSVPSWHFGPGPGFTWDSIVEP